MKYKFSILILGLLFIVLPLISATSSNTKIVCADNSQDTTNCDYLCDGTSDQAEINDAIEDVASYGGGTVKLREGLYIVSDNVLVTSNITLIGNGWATIIRVAPNTDLSESGIVRIEGLVGGGGAKYITIRDLSIDGNKEGQEIDGSGNPVDNDNYGVYCGQKEEYGPPIEHITLQNLYVHNCSSYGVDPHEVTRYFILTDSLIEYNGVEGGDILHEDGVATDNCSYSLFSNNIIRRNQRYGINIVTQSKHNVYSGNSIYNNGGSGIYIEMGSEENSITDNIITNNSGSGINVLGNGTIINDNYVAYNKQQGIKIYTSSHNIIEGNLLISNSQEADNTYSQIAIYRHATEASYSTWNLVSSNIIRSMTSLSYVPKYGIEENSEYNTYNSYFGNVISEADTSGVRILSTSSKSWGNQVDDASATDSAYNNINTGIYNISIGPTALESGVLLGLSSAATGEPAKLRITNGNSAAYFGYTSNDNARLGTTTNNGFEFITNNQFRFKVTPTGYVGIGVSNPAYLFEIANSAVSFNVSGMFYANKTNVGIGVFRPTYSLEIAHSATALNVSGMFYANQTTVGIGTKDPDATLHIVGSVKLGSLAGSYTGGSAYVCINNLGILFASEDPCP